MMVQDQDPDYKGYVSSHMFIKVVKVSQSSQPSITLMRVLFCCSLCSHGPCRLFALQNVCCGCLFSCMEAGGSPFPELHPQGLLRIFSVYKHNLISLLKAVLFTCLTYFSLPQSTMRAYQSRMPGIALFMMHSFS